MTDPNTNPNVDNIIPQDELTVNKILKGHDMSVIHVYNTPFYAPVNFSATPEHKEIKHLHDLYYMQFHGNLNDLDVKPDEKPKDKYQLVNNHPVDRAHRVVFEAHYLSTILQYLAGRYGLE